MADNFDYDDLVSQFAYIVVGETFNLQRDGQTTGNNYIVSDAIDRLFDYVIGTTNSLTIDLVSPPWQYNPQIPVGVDANGLMNYLNGQSSSFQNPYEDSVNQSIGVIGIGNGGIFNGMLVTLILSVAVHADGSSMVHAYIQASPPSQSNPVWTLAASFPELAPVGVLASLTYVWDPPSNIPTLTVCTYTVSENVPAALAFSGEAQLDSVFKSTTGQESAGINFLFGGDVTGVTQQVAGVIDFEMHVPTMSLSLPFETPPPTETITLESFGDLPIAVVTLVSRPMPNMLQRTPRFIPFAYAEVKTALTVTLDNKPIVLPITGIVTDPYSPTLLKLNLSALLKSLTASPGELSALLSGVDISDLDTSSMGDFQLSNQLAPFALILSLNPTGQLIGYVTLHVENSAPWVIIDTGTALLEVQSAQLNITVYPPPPNSSSSLYWTLTVLGSLLIGRENGEINFSFSVGEAEVLVTLADGVITLQDIMGLFMGGGSVDVPDIVLEDFGLAIDAKAGIYAGEFQLESDWVFEIGGEGFSITEIDLKMSYSSQFGAKFKLRGVLELSGILDEQLIMEADYPGKSQGWTFIGIAKSDTTIGDLMNDISTHFGTPVVPLPTVIADLSIAEVKVKFNTATGNFSFMVEAAWQDTTPSASISLEIRRMQMTPASSQMEIAGTLTFYETDETTGVSQPAFEFELIFDMSGASGDTFLAYYEREKGATISIFSLISQMVDPGSATSDQEDFSVYLTEALFAYTNGTYLFGLGVGVALDLSALSGLPVIGDLFVDAPSLDLDLQLMYATAPLPQSTVRNLNRLLKSRKRMFPQDNTNGLPIGLSMSLQLWTEGNQPMTVDFNEAMPPAFQTIPSANGQSVPTATTGSSLSSGIIWFQIQKTFGPLHVSRVGFSYKRDDQRFYGYLDADISIDVITLSLIELYLSFSLTDGGFSSIEFGLNGIGLQFKIDTLSIAGSFFYTETNDGPEYNGYASMGLGPLQLSAIGSYATAEDNNPSLFIFAALDYPLGGLGFFFVNGLSAGFGFNRDLIMPSVSQVPTYWLVQAASKPQNALPPRQGNTKPPSITTILNSAIKYVPVSIGQYWVALGLRFTTYEIVETLAVAAISFGNSLEVDVIGLSTIMIPPAPGGNYTPLGEAQLSLVGSFVVETDPLVIDLMIQGQLSPNSYIFSRSCKLTGGFAFGAWIGGEHSGDFVVTFGGYHPDFIPPSYYPQVPRVGFTWIISNLLNAKGGMYFALTPNAIMAGGSLSILFQFSMGSALPSLRASFDVDVDFLINWKPYHYEINTDAEVDIDVIFHNFGTHEISASAGADLELWGPNFGGHAALHMQILFIKINFDVTFGASDGGSQPLTWQDFQTSLLPPPTIPIPQDVNAPSDSTNWNYVSAQVTSGLVNQTQVTQDGEARNYSVVDPKNFAVMTNSIIPITALNQSDGTEWAGVNYGSLKRDGLGVTPMNQAYTSAVHTLNLEYRSTEGETENTFIPAQSCFSTPQPYSKDVPYALWGTKMLDTSDPNSVNQNSLIANTIGGFLLQAATPVVPGSSYQLARDLFTYETTPEDNAFGWENPGSFTFDPDYAADPSDPEANLQVIQTIQTEMLSTSIQQTRQGVLNTLGFLTTSFNLNQDMTQYTAFAPRYGSFNPEGN